MQATEGVDRIYRQYKRMRNGFTTDVPNLGTLWVGNESWLIPDTNIQEAPKRGMDIAPKCGGVQ